MAVSAAAGTEVRIKAIATSSEMLRWRVIRPPRNDVLSLRHYQIFLMDSRIGLKTHRRKRPFVSLSVAYARPPRTTSEARQPPKRRADPENAISPLQVFRAGRRSPRMDEVPSSRLAGLLRQPCGLQRPL